MKRDIMFFPRLVGPDGHAGGFQLYAIPPDAYPSNTIGIPHDEKPIRGTLRVFCRISVPFQPQRKALRRNIIPMLAPSIPSLIFIDCQGGAFAPPYGREKSMKARTTCLTVLSVVFLGCGTGAEPSQGSSSPTATLDEAITRLTPAEYASAVNKLFGIAPAAQPVPIVGDSTGAFAGVARSADDVALADYDAAVALATIATSAAHLGTMLQEAHCAAPAGNGGSEGAACAAAFISQVAPLAFRNGPVDAPTLAGLNGLYTTVAVTQGAGFSGGLAAVIEEVLQSPYFLYRGLPG
jgi:uncharacterized protein DUF1595